MKENRKSRAGSEVDTTVFASSPKLETGFIHISRTAYKEKDGGAREGKSNDKKSGKNKGATKKESTKRKEKSIQ